MQSKLKSKLKKYVSRLAIVAIVAGFMFPTVGLVGCKKGDVVPVKIELTVAQVTAIAALVAEKTAEAYDILNGAGYVTAQQRENAFKTLRIIEKDGRVLITKLDQGIQLNPADLLALSNFLDSTVIAFAGLAALNLAPDVKVKIQTIADWVMRGTSAARIILVALLPSNGSRGGRAIDLETVTVTVGPLDLKALQTTRGDASAAINGLTALGVNIATQIALLVKADINTVRQQRLASLDSLNNRLVVAGY